MSFEVRKLVQFFLAHPLYCKAFQQSRNIHSAVPQTINIHQNVTKLTLFLLLTSDTV